MSILKWLALVILAITNTIQFFVYRTVRRDWNTYIPVRARITRSKLIDQLNVDGNRDYEADIRFQYLWDGKPLESDTAIMRGPQLFPNWNYEWDAVLRFSEGDTVEARVHRENPEIAFLELAPLSRKSAILLPLCTLLYAIAIIGWTVIFASD